MPTPRRMRIRIPKYGVRASAMKSLVGMSLILLVGMAAAQTPPPKKPQTPPEKAKPDPKAKTDLKGKPEAKPKPKKIKDPVTIKITTTTGQGNKYAGTG